MIRIFLYIFLLTFTISNTIVAQTCIADAGIDMVVCDGEGSSHKVYLDGSGSSVTGGDINYKWTVITEVEDGLEISNSESDEWDPYFKYPDELASDTTFLIELRVYDDDEICESFDTVAVFCYANMCPTAEAGDDDILSNGCDLKVSLDGGDSEDPQDEELSYTWKSLDGYDSNFSVADSVVGVFMFPEIESDKTFSFELEVSDAIHSVTDTVLVNYIVNKAPVAHAGVDLDSTIIFSTCDYQFLLNAKESYDEDWDPITYLWKNWDPDNENSSEFTIGNATTKTPLITSPTDLTEPDTLALLLQVSDGYCIDSAFVLILVDDNICPIADAGEIVRILKSSIGSVTLNASDSYDPEGGQVVYEWTSPAGEITTDSIVTVTDLSPNSRYSSYVYTLQVMDEGLAISRDSVEVIFSKFSAPVSPSIFAVASHAQVLISWGGDPEFMADSLTGYYDFEGFKLYRSIDGGESWGGEDDKLYDYNGQFIGWKPYAQFDYNAGEDYNKCIYDPFECEDQDTRQTAISGLDPLSPRFSLGSNTGIQYSFIDSNVIDGVEYTYTITAYDIGLSPFELDYGEGVETADTLLSPQLDSLEFSYSIDSTYGANIVLPDTILNFASLKNVYDNNCTADSSSLDTNGVETFYFSCVYNIISYSLFNSPDTSWSSLNPGHFLGPDTIQYYNESGQWIRDASNPTGGFLSLESARGSGDDNNIITVVPGYTALDISFPEAGNIEALFTSDTLNIGNGNREYFIVDRTQIVQDKLIYEIEAEQGSNAIDGMACEDPYLFGYVVLEDNQTPALTQWPPFEVENLSFYENDSISGLPGVVYMSDTVSYPDLLTEGDDSITMGPRYIVPEYDIITKIDNWSTQFKGIRYRFENPYALNPSITPTLQLDTLIWSWSSPDSLPMDSLTTESLMTSVFPNLEFFNLSAYNRRLNTDYMIEFFDTPSGDSIYLGPGKYMYTPFRITNLLTNKRVGLYTSDDGAYNIGPFDTENGARDVVWTRGEEILGKYDSTLIGGEWTEETNFTIKLGLWSPSDNMQQWWRSRLELDDTKNYNQGDTVYYQQMLWVASVPADAGTLPQSIYHDKEDDGERNNPWRLAYPWKGGERLYLKTTKLLVDGDKWFSDMTKLGAEIGIADTVCLDTIKVVPNPYKARSKFNEGDGLSKIRFTHLPKKCLISIYTISGELVTSIDHDAEFDGNEWWNLRTGNNQQGPEVAPGLYIYVVEFPDEQDYCIDTFDDTGDNKGSKKNDYFSNKKFDRDEDGNLSRHIKKTKYFIGKFAIVR